MSTDLATLDTVRAAAYIGGTGYSLPEAVAQARNAWGSMHRDAMAFGLHVLAIKAQEPHGRYLDALEEIGIHPRSAQRFAGRVDFLLKMSNATAVAFDQNVNLTVLTGEQLDQLKRLPGPLVEQTLDREAGTIAGRPIGEAAKLTTHEFKRLVMGYLDQAPQAAKAKPDPLMVLCQQIMALKASTDRAELLRKLTVLDACKGTGYRLGKA